MVSTDSLIAGLSSPQALPLLTQLKRGIEKEGLRCDPQGIIAQTSHPMGLGSALTHAYITTDYSEALLEFITPVLSSAHEAMAFLEVLHRYSYSQLGDELIWPASMPCVLPDEMQIPIAQYGSSNVGRLKHVYRHGLWHRYGRKMQCISGIHYNFSLPEDLLQYLADQQGRQADQEFVTETYLGLIRNFRRYGWLLTYLFGASPAVCQTFLSGRQHDLETMHQHTLYLPYATSLRMSDLGYQSNAQSSLKVCHNSLENYIKTLSEALTVPVKEYEEIGLYGLNGEYNQLNTNLLQIENEFYSHIRPKRVAEAGEKPLEALARAGIEYVEIRSTDVNPLLPLGMDIPQMQLLDTFLLWCAMEPSPEISEEEYDAIAANQRKVVNEGRRDGLMLEHQGESIRLIDWGLDLVEKMRPLAKLLDQAHGHSFHENALDQQQLKLADSSLTPSAQILRTLEERGIEFATYSMELAKAHRKALTEPLEPKVQAYWQQMAKDSLKQQREIEDADEMPFSQFLAEYMA